MVEWNEVSLFSIFFFLPRRRIFWDGQLDHNGIGAPFMKEREHIPQPAWTWQGLAFVSTEEKSGSNSLSDLKQGLELETPTSQMSA